ncbi:MAG: PIG-L family deacetylase [Acidobacteriaceae bacterium]|jgi:LmbE family N-acetylglucosaminyl deacetylase|nr:PIG-L family deacetylase [Acidobacteriaceae bacterium]
MITSAFIGRTVLAVFAHPDDESLSCGGTLARLADDGLRVVVVTASHGERGGTDGPVHDPALGDIRAREMRAAAEALGIAGLIIGDHPDGELRWAHVGELHAELTALIRHHQPAAVITFGADGLYWHADHIGVYERTLMAVQVSGAEPPPLYHVTMQRGVMPEIVNAAKRRGWMPPQKGFWSLIPESFGIAAEPPTLTVDVGDWVPRKMRALLCHKSQLGEQHPFEFLPPADARRLLGCEYFHRANIPTTAPPLLEQLCT